MERIDVRSLKAELARQGMTLVALSKRIETRPSTLSAWLHGTNQAPDDLADRVARALGVRRSSLIVRP